MTEETFPTFEEDELRALFDKQDYVVDDEVVIPVLLTLRLGKPLLVEGPPGSGKTELGKVLADGLDTELIRLQCYEGLAAENTLYEWNYTKQLLSVQSDERGVADGASDDAGSVFEESFLLERPLLSALSNEHKKPPVLLIDEIDRADQEFEALLLEVLSDFQVSIPELGTIEASVPPIVIITSNRTRGLSDALKRRCLYLNMEPPSFERECEIIQRKVPTLPSATVAQLCGVVQRLRAEPLVKQPGVAETLDWSQALDALDAAADLSPELLEQTLSCLLKDAEDIGRIDDEMLTTLLEAGSKARVEATDHD